MDFKTCSQRCVLQVLVVASCTGTKFFVVDVQCHKYWAFNVDVQVYTLLHFQRKLHALDELSVSGAAR